MAAGVDRESKETGVSESIGFLLIFTIVIVGIGLVTLYGYPMLLAQQVNADEKIMEKNMIVLQNDLKGITYKTVPYKETSLKIGGGTLTVYNASSTPATSTIRIYDSSRTYVDSFQGGDLRYTSDSSGSDISLQNGAVVKRPKTAPGSFMLAEPRWFYDGQTNTMVINLISINSTGVLAKDGIGTVQMAMGETGYQYTEGINTDIYLDYTPDPTPVAGQDYRTAWDNYFVNTLKMERTSGPDAATITYKLPTVTTSPAKLVIKTYDVVIRSL
ncbi:hypothetical protein [uncultured Methanoregula sp.]|uniref:DUF7289 family protein n=1 Tax=uncultured Methanoregula sp. TaxID=1005933 RepID=UPI002AAB520B|nr:hypothetical protein [uncultured Methanoregula sp.]